MPSVRKVKTHSDRCLEVCVLCFSKTSCKSIKKVGSKEWDIIEKYVVCGLRGDIR